MEQLLAYLDRLKSKQVITRYNLEKEQYNGDKYPHALRAHIVTPAGKQYNPRINVSRNKAGLQKGCDLFLVYIEKLIPGAKDAT